MFDGSIKAVEDIVVGDRLMGDNSDAREVLQLHRGRSPMVRITPSAGEPWICTSNHVMTLVCAEDKLNGDGKTINSVRTKGNVIDIALDTFRARGKSFREYWRLFSRGVEFPTKVVEFDSYIYGMWLGDGGVNHPVLHNVDSVLINRWCDYFVSKGYRIAINSTEGRSCSGYFARGQGGGRPNPFKDFVRASYINGEKRIRRDYLINDREVRMQLLAGLIDTDGYVEDVAFSITTKYIGLRDDIVYLARSLGFKTSARTTVKSIKSLGFTGTYYNVRITGTNLKYVPTLLKKVKRVPKQRIMGTNFKIEDIGEDDYYGFELDGNRRFLLGDFTVTHNTYTATVKFLLRWSEDPQHTSIKLVSTSGGHAKSNIFAGFVKLHNEAVIPLPGFIRESYIGIDINEVQWSIQKVSIGKGEDGTAALRGFHRLPRKTPHPKFGDMSVVFVVVDEADNVPWGFWKGADNIASGAGGKGTIKIYAATNPMLIESEFSSRAQPLNGGRGSIDKDKTFEWEGQQGWHVIRLDVRQSENYKEKREIYQGMMTYESARDYLSKGLDHPDVSTFIYGLYPQASAKYYVVPAFILEDIRGTYNFIKTPVNLASFDPAFEQGGDRAVLTAARYGLANGWRAPNGKLQAITPPRNVLALEQQLEIEKTANPLDMADNLIEVLKRLRVQPEWFVHDMTGNATLLYAYLLRKYGAVMGLKWGSNATESRVFAEDRETAEEQFVGLISEMWFSFSRWAQFNYLKIAPMMQTQTLFNEMSSRKYEQASKTLLKVESKDEFKMNNSGKSPDCFVAGTMVSTPRGETAIELLVVGDVVLTPFGVSSIAFVHKRKTRKLITVHLNNGRKLCGRANHKVFTSAGWTKMDELCIDTTIESVENRSLWLLLDLLFTRMNDTGFKQLVAITPGVTAQKIIRREHFIESSGLSTMALFLKVCASIIRITIGKIIESRIWNSWREAPIPAITQSSGRQKVANVVSKDSEAVTQRRARGTHPQRESSGTVRMPNERGLINDKKSPATAQSVTRTSSVGRENRESNAPFRVGLKSISTSISKIGRACFAALRSAVSNIKRPRLAVLRVERHSGTPVDVYNLTLAQDNAYYCNDVLVDNCSDSMIMAVHLCRIRGEDKAALIPGEGERQLPSDFYKGEDWSSFDRERLGSGLSSSNAIPFLNTHDE